MLYKTLSKGFPTKVGWLSTKKNSQVIQSALSGMVKWPFQRLSDLQLGDQKVTVNHLEFIFLPICFQKFGPRLCPCNITELVLFEPRRSLLSMATTRVREIQDLQTSRCETDKIPSVFSRASQKNPKDLGLKKLTATPRYVYIYTYNYVYMIIYIYILYMSVSVIRYSQLRKNCFSSSSKWGLPCLFTGLPGGKQGFRKGHTWSRWSIFNDDIWDPSRKTRTFF